jgi:hypothetical protein
MYATSVFFFFLHIFMYPNFKSGSTVLLYSPFDFHRIIICPKLTYKERGMPYGSKLVPKIYLVLIRLQILHMSSVLHSK